MSLPRLPLTDRTVARPTPEFPDAPCCEEDDQDRKDEIHGSEGYAPADGLSRAEGHKRLSVEQVRRILGDANLTEGVST